MKLFVGTKGLVMRNGEVLVLREAPYDEGTNTGKWDVPGGRIEPEEPLHVGLRREIMEECGLTVLPEEVLGAFETFPTIKGEPCHIVRVYYACKALPGDVVLSADHSEYEWVDPGSYAPREFVTDIEELLALLTKRG